MRFLRERRDGLVGDVGLSETAVWLDSPSPALPQMQVMLVTAYCSSCLTPENVVNSLGPPYANQPRSLY